MVVARQLKLSRAFNSNVTSLFKGESPKTITIRPPKGDVTFELNVRLDLSRRATTKPLRSLQMKLLLQVLGESTWTVTIWVIRGDKGVGDIPGIRGVSGESAGSVQ